MCRQVLGTRRTRRAISFTPRPPEVADKSRRIAATRATAGARLAPASVCGGVASARLRGGKTDLRREGATFDTAVWTGRSIVKPELVFYQSNNHTILTTVVAAFKRSGQGAIERRGQADVGDCAGGTDAELSEDHRGGAGGPARSDRGEDHRHDRTVVL